MPQQESRVKKSLQNARVNLIFYFLSIILAFFSRKIFLDMLGADFIGLTSTLQNLLGFLNLAEMGIGMAIGYVLYKPLYEHDQNKINEVISVFGYMYSWIGKIILVTGCILACFLPMIFSKTSIDLPVIFFAYFSFLFSSLIGYFYNYKQTLLGADQKNYVVTAYFQTATIIKTLIQMAMAYYFNSYYLWIAIEIAFAILYSFILNWKINQVYPWLKSEIRQGRRLFKKYPEIIKYTKQLFIHKISSFAQFQIVGLLIYAFTTVKLVAYYTNYTLIIDKIFLFLNNFLSSTSAGVGNLIAEGNKSKIIEIFKEFLSLRYICAGIVCTCLIFLIKPLIILWLGEQYLLSNTATAIIIISSFFSLTNGNVLDQFIFGFGMFNDVWSSITNIIINIGASIICGYMWGLEGVILGGLISTFLIRCIWKPYFLYHWGFKISIFQYIQTITHYTILISLSFAGTYLLLKIINYGNTESFVDFILYSLMVFSIITTLQLTLFFSTVKQSRGLLKRILNVVQKN